MSPPGEDLEVDVGPMAQFFVFIVMHIILICIILGKTQVSLITRVSVVFRNSLHQGANLQGVKMLCSNAEGASLRGCNFEDPAGIKANLEGDET